MSDSEEDYLYTHEELVGLEIERLDNCSQNTTTSVQLPYKRRQGKKKESIIGPPKDNSYSISFSTFLETQNPAATADDLHDTVSEANMEEQALQKELLALASEGGSKQDTGKRQMPPPRINTNKKKQRQENSHPSIENQENEPTIQKDQYNEMSDRELILETVKITKSIYRKQFRQEVLEKQILSRLEKVEETCRVQNYVDEQITWPIAKRETLDYIERQLTNEDKQTKKMMVEQFNSASKISLYDFVHDNLVGLLSQVGRWTWTGKKSNAVQGEGPISEKASDLKSVGLLVVLASKRFENQDVASAIIKSFTNINNQAKKKQIRQEKQTNA